MKFIHNRSPVLISNAGFIRFYDNVDLYGLDLCIELIYRLKRTFPNIGFIYAIADENINKNYIENMKNKIREFKIKENFYFITGQKEIWPLYRKVDLMIRPTYRDGYGISIAEALYFNTPAIASDVCRRPSGTILFENRNLEDLYNKCMQILN